MRAEERTCRAGSTPGGPGNPRQVSASGNPEGARGWRPQPGPRAPRQTGKNEVEGWLGVSVSRRNFRHTAVNSLGRLEEVSCQWWVFVPGAGQEGGESRDVSTFIRVYLHWRSLTIFQSQSCNESYKPSPLKNTRMHKLNKTCI